MAIKKFIKFDSEKGYLEHKDDINYFATAQMRRVAFGGMLGDFDENGLYVINQKIVEELIKMPKVIVEMVEDADLIRSKVKADTFFHFILTVEDNKASFKLLEKVHYQSNRDFNSGVYSNINEYVLDEVIVPDKDFDRNALYQKYNISTDSDSEVLSIFDMDELSIALYYNIVEKIKINYLVQNELMLKEKEIENIEADYFEAVLELLEEFEEIDQKVVDGLQDDLAEKHNFVIISKPFFQKTINEILDSMIEQYIQDLTTEQKEQFLIRLREIKANYYQQFKKVLPIEIAQKAGVRFDANQIVEESLIGTLAQEITTKGYTSSDVRRIIIKDDELQLSIAKIKEIVKENEEACKRDNAKAKDITKNRKRTAEFYRQLEAKNKVDMLSPDTTLIKAAIGDKKVAEAKQEKTAAKVDASKVAGKAPAKAAPKKAAAKKPTAKKAAAPKKAATKKPDAKKVVAKKTATNNNTKPDKKQTFIYGSGILGLEKEKAKETELLDSLVDDVILTDRVRTRVKTQEKSAVSVDVQIR